MTAMPVFRLWFLVGVMKGPQALFETALAQAVVRVCDHVCPPQETMYVLKLCGMSIVSCVLQDKNLRDVISSLIQECRMKKTTETKDAAVIKSVEGLKGTQFSNILEHIVQLTTLPGDDRFLKRALSELYQHEVIESADLVRWRDNTTRVHGDEAHWKACSVWINKVQRKENQVRKQLSCYVVCHSLWCRSGVDKF